jgi:hypothetical protein
MVILFIPLLPTGDFEKGPGVSLCDIAADQFLYPRKKSVKPPINFY